MKIISIKKSFTGELMKVFRQGDVIIKPVSKISTEAESSENKVLAEGEVTGHAHRISGDVKVFRNLKVMPALLWIKVLSGEGTVSHEEHEDIKLPPGEYAVNLQREFDWFSEEVRNVQD